VGPFSGESAVAHVVAVIADVDYDCVAVEVLLLECVADSAYYAVNAADHAEICADVLLVLFGCVPSPEPAVSVHGFSEEFGLGIEDCRVGEAWRWDLDVVVHSVDCFWPWEVVFLVAVFCVDGVEAYREAEWLVGGVGVEEFDCLVGGDFCFVSEGAIGLLFVVRASAVGFEIVEHFGAGVFGFYAEFADESCSVSCFSH